MKQLALIKTIDNIICSVFNLDSQGRIPFQEGYKLVKITKKDIDTYSNGLYEKYIFDDNKIKGIIGSERKKLKFPIIQNDERLIRSKMESLLRKQAISELIKEGKIKKES